MARENRPSSVLQIVGANGLLKNAKNYTAFGSIVSETNPSQGDRFGFAGSELVRALNLAQMGALDYWPRKARR